MKIGVIIIFNNNEAQIDKQFFIKQINASKTIELCLVDNNSRDNTLQLLEDIKYASASKVSIVEIKRCISQDAAKRAGARYMFNEFNLKHIGFIDANAINYKVKDFNLLIKRVFKNENFIIDFNRKTIENQDIKQTYFKSIFSVVDYLKKININNLSPSA